MRVPVSSWMLAAVVALLAAPAAAASDQAHRPYGARLAACHRSPHAEGRVAVVSAAMRPIPAGNRMALKIDLYERALAGGRWSVRADVPGLGAWTAPSDPSIGRHATDLFKYRQAVARLDAPMAYRFRVAFHWLDAQGAVVRERVATTRACREPELRPDLFIAGVRVRPVGSAVRYVVNVGNEGESAARGVAVGAVLPGDTVSQTRRVGRVPVGGLVRVTFIGPGCASGAPGPTFTVDPAGAVEESDEANNGFALTCPLP